MREKFADLSYPDAPKITVKPPGPETRKMLEIENKYLAVRSSQLQPMIWDEAKGATVKDVDGNIYVDFSGGFHVANTGHSHPKVARIVAERAMGFLNCASWGHSLLHLALEELGEISPADLKKIVFSSGGAECVENAVKIARRVSGKTEIVSFRGFHGRTNLTAALSGMSSVRKGVGPFPSGILHTAYPYCYRCPFNQRHPECDFECLRYFESVIERDSTPGDVAAIVIEFVQGVGGNVVPPQEYFPRLKEICEKNEILFIAEEVQTGFGRTGKMFASEHWNIVPDMMCAAKGIASGVPTAATFVRERLMDPSVCPPGSVTSTYGGNPLSCAAVIATVQVLKEERIVEHVAAVGEYLLRRLEEMKEKYELIGDVRGKGLMIGIELVKDRLSKEPAELEASKIAYKAFERGLLIGHAGGTFDTEKDLLIGHPGHILRLTPPLVITRELVDKGLEILDSCFKEVK